MTFTSIDENALWCDMVCMAGAELTGHKTVMDDMKVSTAMCKCHCVYELFLGVYEVLYNSQYLHTEALT